MSTNTSKLSSVRDGAIAAGIAIAASFAAYVINDDRRTTREAQQRADLTPVKDGVHGGLFRISEGLGSGGPDGRYVRPATEAEAQASEAAMEVDLGPGVFGMTKGEDGRVEYVLPDSPEWDAAPAGYSNVTYFRVA